jgi:hypothetical protein
LFCGLFELVAIDHVDLGSTISPCRLGPILIGE